MMPQTTKANIRTFMRAPKKHRSRTHRIAPVSSWNDVGIEEECEEFDDRIKIEEHNNLLATWPKPTTFNIDRV
jgi:hypothetical protein